MDTQYTPTYERLWHRDFVLLLMAHLLISMAPCYVVFMLPAFFAHEGLHSLSVAVAAVASGAGIALAGPFVSGIVQRHRRKCAFEWAAVGLALSFVAFWYTGYIRELCMWSIALVSLATGMTYGVAHRVLACTLMVDKTESFHRTEANYVTGWFSRFAFALAPLLALVLREHYSFTVVCLVPAGFVAVAWLCVVLVGVPFKAPEDRVPLLSADRFFLPCGWRLFLCMAVVAVTMGVVLVMEQEPLFYAMLTPGFLLAILLERSSAMRSARHLIAVACVAGACTLSLLISDLRIVSQIAAPLLLGLCAGLLGTRVMLRLIGVSGHSQRCSALATYFLAWDMGLSGGLCAGWQIFSAGRPASLWSVLCLLMGLCVLGAAVSWCDDRDKMESLKA